ncbi:hypothetical protein ST47_g8116 [Ascochyta rabiei]|uniref:Uncharacterized protein n=1 Tax=Didymella rabiei TaxID=5454 RepID=A0A162ZNI8_DIDRA|nr:hypothetical protein ST47_g8116 [Ascochyta rabiei]
MISPQSQSGLAPALIRAAHSHLALVRNGSPGPLATQAMTLAPADAACHTTRFANADQGRLVDFRLGQVDRTRSLAASSRLGR